MDFIKVGISSSLTLFVYLIGGFDIAFKSLIICMTIDYITGLLKASKSNTLNSKIGIQGIKKKIGILCLEVLVTVLDNLIGGTGLIRTPLIYYMVANEGLSICENLGEMNVIIPKFVMKKLEQLRKDDEDV